MDKAKKREKVKKLSAGGNVTEYDTESFFYKSYFYTMFLSVTT